MVLVSSLVTPTLRHTHNMVIFVWHIWVNSLAYRYCYWAALRAVGLLSLKSQDTALLYTYHLSLHNSL